MEKDITTRLLVKDVMNSPAITTSKDTNVREIAKIMSEMDIGAVVITDGDRTVGIVTEKDIVTKAVVKDMLPSTIKASEIMSEVVGIESEESITEAAKLFRKHGIKRLVVFYKGKVVGIVSTSDVIAVMPELVDVISEKSKMLKEDISKQHRPISGYCDECEEWSDYLMYVEGRFICEDCREVRS